MIKAGEKLKEERLKKDLSLDEIAKTTKIKSIFLEFIEQSEYQKLPSASYASGFVKNYAKALGLNEEDIMALFRREFDQEKEYKVLPKGFEKTEEFPVSRFRNKRFIFAMILFFVIFIGYILFQYRYAFINPPLDINSPTENALINSSSINVSGKTDSNSTIYINQDLVSVDQNGNFEKTISVFPGNAVITIRSISKFLRQTEKKVDIKVQGGS